MLRRLDLTTVTRNVQAVRYIAHREEWSARRELDITRHSKAAAVQAMFYGNSQFDLAPELPWRGSTAFPIVIDSVRSDATINGAPADRLTIGAVTLNSTYKIQPGGRLEAPNGGVGQGHLSVVSVLAPEDVSTLQLTLLKAIGDVIWSQ